MERKYLGDKKEDGSWQIETTCELPFPKFETLEKVIFVKKILSHPISFS
jgi:hypothetical protein